MIKWLFKTCFMKYAGVKLIYFQNMKFISYIYIQFAIVISLKLIRFFIQASDQWSESDGCFGLTFKTKVLWHGKPCHDKQPHCYGFECHAQVKSSCLSHVVFPECQHFKYKKNLMRDFLWNNLCLATYGDTFTNKLMKSYLLIVLV